jgi:hypothetical protein
MSIMLGHPDTVSGTTIMSNMTKVYWTEGSGDTVIVSAYGDLRIVPSWSDDPDLTSDEIRECNTKYSRPMTEAEVAEWKMAMSMVS